MYMWFWLLGLLITIALVGVVFWFAYKSDNQ